LICCKIRLMQRLRDAVYNILRWSEKYVKTDMIYLTKGGFWLLFSYSIQAITGLILSVSFANLLAKESYGFYQFVISMASILAVFSLTGIGTAIIRGIAQGDEGCLRPSVKVSLKWTLGILLTAAATSLYYWTKGNYQLSIAFAVVAIAQPLITTFNLYKTYLQGKKLFKSYSVIQTAQRLLPFTLLLIAILCTRNPLTLVIVYFISHAISAVLIYLYVVIKFKLPKQSEVKDLVKYGKHLSLMESMAELATAADKVLIWFFLGAAPTAAYALAQLPIIHLQAMFGFIRELAFPKIAQKSLPGLAKALPEKIRTYWIVALAVVVLYIISAPTIFHIFLPKYPEAVIYTQVLSLVILVVPRSLVTHTFAAHQRTKELYLVNFSTPIIRLSLLAIGLPMFGIWGVIGATLISEWCAALLQWKLFSNIINKISWPKQTKIK
jgi:O-antigen/teichoic acid export membrane protein